MKAAPRQIYRFAPLDHPAGEQGQVGARSPEKLKPVRGECR